METSNFAKVLKLWQSSNYEIFT